VGCVPRRGWPRPEKGHLAQEIGQAGGLLVGGGIPVHGRPALHHVGDVGVPVPVEPYRGEHLVQELAGRAHEGKALGVLVGPRPSPTTMTKGRTAPVPGTARFRLSPRRHFAQARTSAAMASSPSPGRAWRLPSGPKPGTGGAAADRARAGSPASSDAGPRAMARPPGEAPPAASAGERARGLRPFHADERPVRHGRRFAVTGSPVQEEVLNEGEAFP
jgi:hypothetical protein